VRRVEQMIIRQVADRAAMIVCGEHAVPEGCLMQPLLDQAEDRPRVRAADAEAVDLSCLKDVSRANVLATGVKQ
jgi:hypothetical protein